MRVLAATSLLSLFCFAAHAENCFDSRPWTKSFLDTTLSFSLERVSPSRGSKKSCRSNQKGITEGVALFSTAPYPEWQVDVAVAGKSIETGKIAGRAEKLLFSDLQGSPCAVSCVFGLTVAREKRVKKPTFFEMARHAAEGGVGVGKHFYVGKNSYTQVFSYLLGGIGKGAEWTNIEIGLFHSFFQKHSIRCSLSHLKSFGHYHEFHQGYGSIETQQKLFSFQYTVRFTEGDLFIRYGKRWLERGPIRSAQTWRIGLSFDLFPI